MEALEGMKVAIYDPVVTGPTSRGGTWVLPDGGDGATSVSMDGLAYVGMPMVGPDVEKDSDYNPEAVQLSGGVGPRMKRAAAG